VTHTSDCKVTIDALDRGRLCIVLIEESMPRRIVCTAARDLFAIAKFLVIKLSLFVNYCVYIVGLTLDVMKIRTLKYGHILIPVKRFIIKHCIRY